LVCGGRHSCLKEGESPHDVKIVDSPARKKTKEQVNVKGKELKKHRKRRLTKT
jgi:hypothetical protein